MTHDTYHTNAHVVAAVLADPRWLVAVGVALSGRRRAGRRTTHGAPGSAHRREVPLPDASDGRLGQARRLPDLRDEAGADRQPTTGATGRPPADRCPMHGRSHRRRNCRSAGCWTGPAALLPIARWTRSRPISDKPRQGQHGHGLRAGLRGRGRGRVGRRAGLRAAPVVVALSPERRSLLGVRSEEVRADAHRADDPHGRPRGRRRAAPRARPHEVRGLRRAALRRLHRASS